MSHPAVYNLFMQVHRNHYFFYNFDSRRIRKFHPRGGFRDSFYYNNVLYGLLTDIGERLGGKSWEKLVQQEFYSPIGMTNSSFFTTLDPNSINIATGYKDDNGDLYPTSFELLR